MTKSLLHTNSDLTEANLHAIATLTSTIALSVAPSVSSAFPEADNIPDDDHIKAVLISIAAQRDR